METRNPGGSSRKGHRNMAIYGWSKLLTLVQAMDHDTDCQAKRKLKTLNTLAALAEEEKGTTVMPTFADRVQAAAGASTPMKRPLETELKFNQRRTIEQAGTAYSSALLLLKPEQREGFIDLYFFLDPETNKIETAELLAKWMKFYSRLVLPSLREHHSNLIETVPPGDIAGMLRKVTRDTAESIKHTKSSLLDQLKGIKRQTTVENTYDKFMEVNRKYTRIFTTPIDEDVLVQRFIACMSTHPDKTFAKKALNWRIEGKIAGVEISKIKDRYAVIEDELRRDGGTPVLIPQSDCRQARESASEVATRVMGSSKGPAGTAGTKRSAGGKTARLTTQPAKILLKQPRITPTNSATELEVARRAGAVGKRGILNATVQRRKTQGTGLTTVQQLITQMPMRGVG